MREKARNLVYLDPERYLDINSAGILPWATMIIPFIIFFASVSLHYTAIAITVCVCFLSKLIFVRIIQSDRIKKSFRLRFLVNGMMSFYVYADLFLLALMFSIATRAQVAIWLLSSVIVFDIAYIVAIVFMVHRDKFKGYKKEKINIKFKKASMIAGIILPTMGSLGYFTSKLIDKTNAVPSSIKLDIIFILLSFLLAALSLGFVNFVQYFYCVKYKINCDEKGKDSSPLLESTKAKSK